MSDEWLDKIFRVNLMSHFSLIREFLPAMLEMRKGHIVSMASMATYICSANMVDYGAAKAGVLALHEGRKNTDSTILLKHFPPISLFR